MNKSPSTEALLQLANQVLDSIPFNQTIRMRATDISATHTRIRFDMHPLLIGNPIQGILHGGVMATVMDMTAGIAIMAHLYSKKTALQPEELHAKLGKIGTVDFHISYLRPGRGEHFTATAKLLQSGNKISVANVELFNHEPLLIAVATATFLVG